MKGLHIVLTKIELTMKTTDKNKKIKNKPLKALGGVLTASMILFGAASCTQDTTMTDTPGTTTTGTPTTTTTTGTTTTNDGVATTDRVANRDVSAYDDWETNTNLRVDQSEFDRRMTDEGAYENWQNEQGQFTQTEFNQGVFSRWDADQDGYLSADEYATGNATWETQYGNNFGVWDQNRDSRLDPNEYNQGMTETGIFNEWDRDRDGTINTTEFNQGTFNTWDTNRDGYLDNNEYNSADYDTWSGSPADSSIELGNGIDR